MKLRITIVLFLFFNQLSAQQTHQFPQFEQVPLRQILQYLETNFDLVFAYRDNNVSQSTISITKGKHEIKSFLSLLFNQTNLHYEFIDEKHIILTRKKNSSENFGYLCGYVKDKQTLQPLSFASVLIKNSTRGIHTNGNGWFELGGLKELDTLEISYIGYQSKSICFISGHENDCPSYWLKVNELSIPEVEVKEYLTDGISQTPKGNSIVIDPQRLSLLPGAVEPDIMTAIQMLPGIFSPNETASGLHIRGGTPDQNLVLWDGIPVYHTGHFFGMISAFNPYVVEEFQVYRSGMGSEFGGRVSGVIDIQSKDIRPKKINIGLGLNMTHWHINAEFPLWKNAAFYISLRRSFTDSWASPTFLRYAEKVFQGTKLEEGDFSNPETEASDKFYFADMNWKWIWNSGKNKFRISMFAGENNLDYTNELLQFNALSNDLLKLTNVGFNLFWQRAWNPKFSTTVSLTNSQFEYDYSLSVKANNPMESLLGKFSSKNNVEDIGLNFTSEWLPKNNHKVKFGYQVTDNQIDLNFKREGLLTESAVDSTIFNNKLHTLFGEYQLSIANTLDVSLGLRYQRQTIINNDYFEPRLSLNAHINDHLKLKMSSSKQFQFVSQLVVLDINDIGLNNEIWIASDNVAIPVIESNQWSGGILFTKNDWTIDLEGYVKELAGITTLSNSFGNIPDQPFSKGNARIRGVDVLIKKRLKNYRSWLSYTLSKAVYEFPNINPSPFPALHDQRHAFQWVHIVSKKPWEFSVGWQYRTGLPFTNAESVDFYLNANQESIPFLVYEEQHNSRLVPYHRLDASVLYHFEKHGKFKGFAGISFLNFYNHKNVLEKRFLLDQPDPSNGEYDILELTTVGLKFTPNIVFRIEW